MSQTNLSELDLASLLCSRVCHDVISPVGAIANGLEVLEDEKDFEIYTKQDTSPYDGRCRDRKRKSTGKNE